MKNKQRQSQNMVVRIITSPLRVLGKAKDFYIRSITNCGNSMNYSNPMDVAGRFEALPRSYSAATTKLDDREDFAELMRAASDRTLMEKLDMDLVLKKKEASKVLPKSVSAGMGKIDEDSPCDFGDTPLPAVPDLYPRSRSYAVTRTAVAVF
ncbi:uncharacterized protein LOC114752183 [Neltuma alba]|uniref:uncharacterized protein LOC114751574 n=1 Tax=Neltuma alba TaxID=207710 RepID=UPI0010A3703B|nr:uncharacterized protein LOC114751574 [Prosopis alba]XP_028796742.1 uncharacterized protein LOC114752183 [Prosopis alba]